MVLLHRSHNSEMSACFFLCASLEEPWWRRPPPFAKALSHGNFSETDAGQQTLVISQVDSGFPRFRQVTHGHVLALALTALQENQGGLMVGFLLSFCLFDSSKSNNKVVFWRHQSTDVQRCLMSCWPLAAGLLGQDECSHPVPWNRLLLFLLTHRNKYSSALWKEFDLSRHFSRLPASASVRTTNCLSSRIFTFFCVRRKTLSAGLYLAPPPSAIELLILWD